MSTVISDRFNGKEKRNTVLETILITLYNNYTSFKSILLQQGGGVCSGGVSVGQILYWWITEDHEAWRLYKYNK